MDSELERSFYEIILFTQLINSNFESTSIIIDNLPGIRITTQNIPSIQNNNLDNILNGFSDYSEYLDLLLDSEYFDDFWKPVVVSLDPCFKLPEIEIEEECVNCCENKNKFNILLCCSKELCVECVDKWFGISVYCPYCKKDLRELT